MCLTLLVFHHIRKPVDSSSARLTVLYLWNLHLLDLSKIRGVIADRTGFHFITARGWIPGGSKQAGCPDFPLVSSVDPSYWLCPGSWSPACLSPPSLSSHSQLSKVCPKGCDLLRCKVCSKHKVNYFNRNWIVPSRHSPVQTSIYRCF